MHVRRIFSFPVHHFLKPSRKTRVHLQKTGYRYGLQNGATISLLPHMDDTLHRSMTVECHYWRSVVEW